MKKNFKKFIATSLALGALASTVPTFAVKPTLSEPKSAIAETIPDLASCVREFESLAPGVFCVEPNLIKATDPTTLSKALSQIIKILKAYPNITRKLVEATQKLTTTQKFKIKLLDKDDIHAKVFNVTGEADPIAMCTAENAEFAMYINPTLLQKGTPNHMLKTNADPITQIITHEMGHIFSLVNMYHKNPVTFSCYLDDMQRLMFAGEKYLTQLQPKFGTFDLTSYMNPSEDIEDILKSLEGLLTSPEYIAYTQSQEYIDSIEAGPRSYFYQNESSEKIKEEIVDLAKKRGHIGSTYLSGYSSRNAAEWIAETFANALCNDTLEPLRVATLEYWGNFEKNI